MAKRKNLQNNIDEYEKGYIQAKLDGKQIIAESNDAPYQFKQMPYNINIKCKNQKQKEFLNLLKNNDKIICVGHGSAGTGKSWIAYSYALSQLKDESSGYDQIAVFIATAQAGDKEINLGLLKGDLEQKTINFCDGSIYTMEQILKTNGNYNYQQIVESLINSKRLTFDWIQFLRGKTFNNTIIIIEEGENVSIDEMKLILTRLGTNSKIIIIGDNEQMDRPSLRKNGNGMSYSVEKLQKMEEFGDIKFNDEDIVRNPLITKILQNWNN